MNRWIVGVLGAAAWLAGASFGATNPAPASAPNGESAILRRADALHSTVSRNAAAFSRWVDSFFGNQLVEEEVSGTRIRVTTAMEMLDGEGTTLKLRMNAKLALPRLDRRVQLFFSAFEDDTAVGGPSGQAGELAGEEEQRRAGLRFNLREKKRFRLQSDVGLRFRPDPDPYTRLRARYLVLQEPLAIRLTQSLFWFREDGVGETSRVDFEKMIGRNTFVRQTLEATWSETSRGVDWSPAFSAWHALSGRRAIGAEWNMKGYTHPYWTVDSHRITLRYRQRIWRDWLYVQASPFADFPRSRNYEFSPGLAVQFEVVFGDDTRP